MISPKQMWEFVYSEQKKMKIRKDCSPNHKTGQEIENTKKFNITKYGPIEHIFIFTMGLVCSL